tara:strand:+ start:408 stop:704 length:297 start_codon:yes stop_codon:yes gene_type:complete
MKNKINPIDENTIDYRGIKFYYKEWITYDGKQANGYQCNDTTLLKGLNTVSFGAQNITEMCYKIDDYIDNKTQKLKDQAMYDKAEQEFMEKYGTLHAD